MRYAILALIALAGTGCGDSFTSATVVEDLRILAIQADPPGVETSDVIEFHALVADPLGAGREISATWTVCLFEVGNTASEIPCPDPDGFPLSGDGMSATLNMPELMAWLRDQGVPTDPGDGEGRDDLPITIGLEVAAGDEIERGIKRIKVRLGGEEPLNHNPSLTGLEVDGQPVGAEPIILEAGGEHVFKPLVAAGSQEMFVPEGKEEAEPEEHLFSWFSTDGSFKDQRTFLDVDSQGDPMDDNDFTAPETPGTYDLWIVVNDDRYGIDWLGFTIEVISP